MSLPAALTPLLSAIVAVMLIAPGLGWARSAHTVQVICIASSSPVESPAGFYAQRPPNCNFHQRGRPAAFAFLVEMRHIRWRHWGPNAAVGRGRSLANMVGPVSTKVRLSAPRNVCGHRVFTVARFKIGHHGYGPGLQLDRRLSRCR